MTTFEALRKSVNYPISLMAIEVIAITRGLNDEPFTTEISQSESYRLSTADVIKYLVTSANISEGGVSISITDRDILVGTANSIYKDYGVPLIGVNATVNFLPW